VQKWFDYVRVINGRPSLASQDAQLRAAGSAVIYFLF
jgi:hypothetical protein